MVDYIYWGILILALIYSAYVASKRDKSLKISRDEFKEKHEFYFESLLAIKRERELHRHGFKLLLTGDDEEITNVLWKSNDGCELYIFDYQFFPKLADRSTHNKATQRAIFFKFPDELFHFELLPEGIIEKIKQLFGNEDIDFEEFPLFSKNYSLRTNNKEVFSLKFPKELIEFIGSKKGICIESRQNNLLIYKDDGGAYSDYEELYTLALKIKDILVGGK